MPIFDPLSIFDPTELHCELHFGDPDLLKRLLKFGINVNATSEIGVTAFFIAAQWGLVDIVKLLLDEGVDPDGKDKDGNTALIWATAYCNKACVTLLLNYGAQRFQDDRMEMIHIIAVSGDETRMNDLLAVGNDLDKIDNFEDCHFTALHYAARAGNEEIVKILLKNGAKYDSKSRNEMNETGIIHSAAFGGNVEILKIFMELNCDIHERVQGGKTILHYAAEGANVEMIKFILDQGIDLQLTDDDERNALFSAILGSEQKIKESVRLLLNLGLQINNADNEGITPLSYAVSETLVSSVEVLLKLGASIRPQMLADACTDVNKNTVFFLLKHGANINDKDNEGNGVLSCALRGLYDAYNEREAVVDILIKHGADVKTEKSLVWDLVSTADDLDILLETNDNYFKTLKGNRGIAKKLLQCGLDINLRDEEDCSVLEHVIYNQRANTAFLTPFLDHGLDINEVQGDEETSVIQFSLDNEATIHAKILTRHVVKMIHRKQHVSDENLQDIQNNRELSLFWNKCEEEIDLMKLKRGVFNLFISQESHRLAKLANQKGVSRLITVNRHKTMYPIYADHLEEQFEKGTQVMSLLREVNRFFHAVAESEGNENLPRLPGTNPIFISKIFEYLDIKDLETLAYVCNPRRLQ